MSRAMWSLPAALNRKENERLALGVKIDEKNRLSSDY